MATLDNASAQVAIALQIHDLDELEASGTADRLLIGLQRQQLEFDSGFDATGFEASRRLARSMARAVDEDSALLAPMEPSPRLDDATYHRLAMLNRESSTPSNRIEQSKPESQKRAKSLTPEEVSSASINPNDAELRGTSDAALYHSGHSHKKVKVEQAISGRISRDHLENGGMIASQDLQVSTAEVNAVRVVDGMAASTTAIESSPATAACASCSDHFAMKELVKVSCDHQYCKDCFGHFMEASLTTHDGFPPKCCKIPIAFVTVAKNVSTVIFSRYSARQTEIKNATALYCGNQKCGVKIEKDRIKGLRATCVTCWRDTCTQCRDKFPQKVEGRNDGHVCKKDKAREQVLALAKKEGWQTCYQCGNMVALNFGCHHMKCRCEAEFCYRCGTKWKNCACGDYDEPQLQIRAIRGIGVRAARRVAQGLPPDPRPREQQLAELQQRLQVDCDHNNFIWVERSREVPGHCEICEYRGWKYILRCDNCRFTACRECHNFHGWNGGEDPWEPFQFGIGYHEGDTDDEPVSDYRSIDD